MQHGVTLAFFARWQDWQDCDRDKRVRWLGDRRLVLARDVALDESLSTGDRLWALTRLLIDAHGVGAVVAFARAAADAARGAARDARYARDAAAAAIAAATNAADANATLYADAADYADDYAADYAANAVHAAAEAASCAYASSAAYDQSISTALADLVTRIEAEAEV